MTKRKTKEVADNDYQPLPGEIVSDGEAPEAGIASPQQTDAAGRPSVRRAAVLSDLLAGTKLYFDYEQHRAEIEFKEKPGNEIITFMHGQGFGWDRERKVWQMPIRFQQREQDRLSARRTFHKASEMVRKEKGIGEDGPGLPD
jgi:hypothetical protein